MIRKEGDKVKVRFTDNIETMLFEYKGGHITVELSKEELAEYRIVEKMFYEWQRKLKGRAKDSDNRNIFRQG